MNIFKIKYFLFFLFVVLIGLNMYIYSQNASDKDAEYKLTDAKLVLILDTNSTMDRGCWHNRHSMFFVQTLVNKKDFIELFIQNGWQTKSQNPFKMTKGSVMLEIIKTNDSNIGNINNFYIMDIDTSKTKTILDIKDLI